MQRPTKNFVLAALAVAVVLVTAVCWVIHLWHVDPLPPFWQDPHPEVWLSGQKDNFTVGANYPWASGAGFGANSWGHYGVSTPDGFAKVDTDFAELEAENVHVVRWWLLSDGRQGIVYDKDGTPIGVDQYLFKDMDAAIEIARRHHIYLIFAMFSFEIAAKGQIYAGVQLFGRKELLLNPIKQQALLKNVLKPIFVRYGHDPNIIAWDIINEPEWAMEIHFGSGISAPIQKVITPLLMQHFVRSAVQLVHENTKQWATVGSASRGYIDYWRNCGLDFYQFHYYPKFEQHWKLDYPVGKMQLDKPVVLGEFATKNGERSVSEYFRIAQKDGLAAAWFWSMNATDEATDYPSARPQILLWMNRQGEAAKSHRKVALRLTSRHK